MAEKGRTWSERETKLLLQVWCEDRIQRLINISPRNPNAFRIVVEELAKAGFQRTVDQCRTKIKALKKKYKEIKDKARKSGEGCESDEDADLPADFPYFEVLDKVMATRANVSPVHLLDSATIPAVTTVDDTVTDVSTTASSTSHSSHSTPLASPTNSGFVDISGVCSSQEPVPVEDSYAPFSHVVTTSTSSVVSTPATTMPLGTSTTVVTPTTVTPSASKATRPSSRTTDGTPVPKKRRVRVTNIQRAERAASTMVREILDAQAEEREEREKREKEQEKREKELEKKAEERDDKLLSTMSGMLNVMSQFMSTFMGNYPSGTPAMVAPYMSGQPIPPLAPYPLGNPPPVAPYPPGYHPTSVALYQPGHPPTPVAHYSAGSPPPPVPTSTAGDPQPANIPHYLGEDLNTSTGAMEPNTN